MVCQVSVLSPDVSRAGRAGRTGSTKKGEAILMVDEKEFARKRHRLLTEALPSVRSCLYDVRGWGVGGWRCVTVFCAFNIHYSNQLMPEQIFGVYIDLDKIG